MIVRTGTVLFVLGTLAALSTPALADTYPVSGRWGQSASSEKKRIECHGRRVITFRGNQRFDSGGGVPGYHLKSVTSDGPSRWRIVDQFTTGQIRAANSNYTLTKIDAFHIVLDMTPGGSLKLQRCK